MKWHEMKWPEIQELDKQIPVVIPLGSIEQHGLHLPLCTDTSQVSAIADAVEQQMNRDAIVLPTLWLGSSDHHMDFPGTVSATASLYSQIITSLACSILGAGFQRLFFLNGHGGNETPITQALTELTNTHAQARQALLASSNWWQIGKPDPNVHHMTTGKLSHACEYETSLMLHLHPDLVSLDDARDWTPSPLDSETNANESVRVFRRFSTQTAAGNLGTPSCATATKGQSIHHAVVDDIVKFVHQFANWPLPKSIGPTR